MTCPAEGHGGMKIGSQARSSSAVSASNPETIVVRGRDLCAELIGQVSFTEHAWLLVTGSLPSAAQRRMLDATLVAMQGAVAAGLLGCGSVILGSAESAARLLAGILARSAQGSLEPGARAALEEARAAKRAVPGYGHPLHKQQDPRVARLLAIAGDTGIAGRHVEAARLVERLLPEATGKPLVMNVSGAIAAVMLDAGYPLTAIKGVPMLARTASLIAHLVEEQERPIGFVLADSGASAISYDGPAPPGFVPTA
jgi:citrate synthase